MRNRKRTKVNEEYFLNFAKKLEKSFDILVHRVHLFALKKIDYMCRVNIAATFPHIFARRLSSGLFQPSQPSAHNKKPMNPADNVDICQS